MANNVKICITVSVKFPRVRYNRKGNLSDIILPFQRTVDGHNDLESICINFIQNKCKNHDMSSIISLLQSRDKSLSIINYQLVGRISQQTL